MGYINFRIGKMKQSSEISRAQSHNQRKAFCENTDPARRFLNRQIMSCADDYEKFYNRRIAASPAYKDGKQPRNDAVKLLDLEFRVSAEEMANNPFFDLDKFCQDTKAWVCKKFGAENVADLVLHMDEGYGAHEGELKCAPHIHAIVVPMTKDGRLSAAEFVGSPKKLRELQTEVAEQYTSMKLKRGMEGSVANHTEMKEFYGWVHSARVVDLPQVRENETGRQYAARIIPEIQKLQSQQLAERLKLERERDEALTRVKQLEAGMDVDKAAIEREKLELEKREKRLRDKEDAFLKDYKALQEWNAVLLGLQHPNMSEEDRKAFMKLAAKALEIGEAERDARESEAEELVVIKAEDKY